MSAATPVGASKPAARHVDPTAADAIADPCSSTGEAVVVSVAAAPSQQSTSVEKTVANASPFQPSWRYIPRPAKTIVRVEPRRTPVLALALTDPKGAFLAAYEDLRHVLLADMTANLGLEGSRVSYATKMMDLNCLGGKYNRGISVMEIALEMTASMADTTRRERVIHDSIVCGWAIEFMQAHFLVLDDIMDHSLTRRGKPCWYKYPGVTTSVAINDGLILVAWVTRLIRIFLGEYVCCSTVLDILHDVHMKTCMGQFYDTTSMVDSAALDPEKEATTTTTFVDYTVATYKRIAKFKTSFYTYHAPFLLGLAVSNRLHVVDADLVQDLALTVGEYFQIQDDFLDCFGTFEQIGKHGTDIEDKKCTWLAASFLAKATAEQRAEFIANYGLPEPEKVAVIKRLYTETGMKELFEAYESATVETVERQLTALATQDATFAAGVKKLWQRTYKRSK